MVCWRWERAEEGGEKVREENKDKGRSDVQVVDGGWGMGKGKIVEVRVRVRCEGDGSVEERANGGPGWGEHGSRTARGQDDREGRHETKA